MCKNHDELHYLPELRSVAATMAGVHKTAGARLDRAKRTRDMLLAQATCIGLLDYLDVGAKSMPPEERMRCRVKLLALCQALQGAALEILRGDLPEDDVPF